MATQTPVGTQRQSERTAAPPGTPPLVTAPSASAASPMGRGMSGGLVLLFAVAVGLSIANNNLAQPLLAALRSELHTSTQVAALLVTAAQVGYALGLILLLPLGDLFERRRLVTALALLTSAFLVAASLAPSIWVLLAAVGLVAFTSALAQILVAFGAGLADPAQRGSVIGTIMSGLFLGVLLARTASGAIAELGGWRTVYAVAAGLMFCVALLLWWRVPRYKEDNHLSYPGLLKSVLTVALLEPSLRWRSLYGLLSFASFVSLWTTLAFLLAGPDYGYSEGVIGLFGLIGAGGALMASIAGRLNDRGWTRRLSGLMPALMAAGFVFLWLGRAWLWAVIVGIVLVDIASRAIQITNQTVIYTLRPAARSRINSFYMTSCFVGSMLGSLLAAFVYARFGWTAVCIQGGCLAGLIVPLWAVELASGKRHSAGGDEVSSEIH
jgi:predicted MFS family arabinose efflux permease